MLRRFLYGMLFVFLFFSVLMLVPRAYSFMMPDKPPIGYHFLWTSYLAIMVGLEDLIDTEPEVPADFQAFTNIEYKNIDNNSLQLDIYKPQHLDSAGALVVFLHGGGWRGGHRADMLPLIIDFTQRGYVTATVSYRLRRPYPECVDDVSDAVDWFFKHGGEFGYDTNRIALVGASAGAHLAMMAGYGWREKTSGGDTLEGKHRVRAIVNIFGPVDLTTDFARKQPLANSFIGKSYEEAEEVYLEASPIVYVDKSAPPTLTIHGTSDELVPNSQADQLKNRLDSLGVPCVDYRFPLWPHAHILVQRVYDDCIPKMDRFLHEYLVDGDKGIGEVRELRITNDESR